MQLLATLPTCNKQRFKEGQISLLDQYINISGIFGLIQEKWRIIIACSIYGNWRLFL